MWNDAKEDARCTGLHCDRAAATCRRHSDTDNASEELKDWLARNETQFVSNVVTVNSPQANIYAHPSVINEFKAFLESCNIKLKNLSSEDLKFKFTEFMEMRNSEQSARVLSVVENSSRNSDHFPDSDVVQVSDEVKTSSFRYRCHTVNVAKDSQMRGNSSPNMKPLILKTDQSNADEFFDAHENLVGEETREKCYSPLDSISVPDVAFKLCDGYPAPVNPSKCPRKEVEMDGKTFCSNLASRSSLMLTMVLLNLLLTLWFGCMLMSFKCKGEKIPNSAIFIYSKCETDANTASNPLILECFHSGNNMMKENVKIHGHLINTVNEDINVQSIPIQIAIKEPEMSPCATKCNNEESFMCSSEFGRSELHITGNDDKVVNDDVKNQVDKVELLDDYIQKPNKDLFDINTKCQVRSSASLCLDQEAINLMEKTLALKFEARERISTFVPQLAMILIPSMKQRAMFSADASSNNIYL